MLRKETVRARVTPELKHDVEEVLGNVGLSMSEAINLFMAQVRLHQGLPFEVKIPNKLTKQTLDDADKGKGLHAASDLDDLWKQLED